VSDVRIKYWSAAAAALAVVVGSFGFCATRPARVPAPVAMVAPPIPAPAPSVASPIAIYLAVRNAMVAAGVDEDNVD
jgi:hypothetical protein